MHSITLQTNDATITANDVLGRLAFAAPNEDGGGESTKVVGKIEVQAEEAFDADDNAAKMVFSLSADGSAATRMTLSSAGTATLIGNLIIADGGNIGSASDTDAIAIASDGVVSFSATNICPASDDGTALGTGSKRWSDLFLGTGGVINLGNGDVTLTHSSNAVTVGGGKFSVQHNTGQLAEFKRITGAGNAYITVDASAVQNDEEAQLRLLTGSEGECRIYFGDTHASDDVSGTRACICYDHDKSHANGERMIIKTGNGSNDTGTAAAITIDTNQTSEFHGAIRQDITSATEDATVTIDLSDGNYFNITLGAEVTNLVLTNGSDGQRFLIRFTQPAGANYAVSCWDGGTDITHDEDATGGGANVTVKWAGGITPTMTRTNAKADTYGFIINDEDAFDGFIVGQNI